MDRTQPLLPMTFAKTEKRTHDYTRHGTTNLFAALNTATGEVVGRCFARRRTEEFLKFMNQVVATYDDREIQVVLNNLSTHSASDVDKWLARHPNVTFHVTPTGSSWLNHGSLVRHYYQTSHQAGNLHVATPTHQNDQKAARQQRQLSVRVYLLRDTSWSASLGKLHGATRAIRRTKILDHE